MTLAMVQSYTLCTQNVDQNDWVTRWDSALLYFSVLRRLDALLADPTLERLETPAGSEKTCVLSHMWRLLVLPPRAVSLHRMQVWGLLTLFIGGSYKNELKLTYIVGFRVKTEQLWIIKDNIWEMLKDSTNIHVKLRIE